LGAQAFRSESGEEGLRSLSGLAQNAKEMQQLFAAIYQIIRFAVMIAAFV
jgi:hypothetical protein